MKKKGGQLRRRKIGVDFFLYIYDCVRIVPQIYVYLEHFLRPFFQNANPNRRKRRGRKNA